VAYLKAFGSDVCSAAGEYPPMDRTIARLNIEHFQKLLAKETDEASPALL
jgi:hypothetical protein